MSRLGLYRGLVGFKASGFSRFEGLGFGGLGGFSMHKAETQGQ